SPPCVRHLPAAPQPPAEAHHHRALPAAVQISTFSYARRQLECRLGNKEIAKALKISESTVKFHLSNIFRKLGVRDRHSAAEVKVAIRKGRSLPFFRNRHALFPSRVWPLFVR